MSVLQTQTNVNTILNKTYEKTNLQTTFISYTDTHRGWGVAFYTIAKFLNSKIRDELITSILKKAAILEIENKKK